MAKDSSRLTVVFSCIGHLYIHFCTAFFFVIVLALDDDWNLPYHELIELWTLGSLLVGLAALPAGLLCDRVGASSMMAVFFLGMGGSSILASLASSPRSLLLALTGIGLFAAIYHPVGIPWLVRNAGVSRGKALGVNGVFGSLGSALAGVVSGALIDAGSWRTAFLVPGVVCTATGGVLLVSMAAKWVRDPKQESKAPAAAAAGDSRRVFAILLVTMFCGGLVYHSTQTSLPKLVELRHDGLAGAGVFGVGLLVALVYGTAGVMQVVGGHLADRYPLKPVYLGAILFQAPLLFLASSIDGAPLLAVLTLMVMGSQAALPAENLLLARHTPENRHGLAFGVKFVLFFAAAPLAVELASFVARTTGEFSWLYVLLAALAATAFLIASFLPRERRLAGSPHLLTDSPAVPNME